MARKIGIAAIIGAIAWMVVLGLLSQVVGS